MHKTTLKQKIMAVICTLAAFGGIILVAYMDEPDVVTVPLHVAEWRSRDREIRIKNDGGGQLWICDKHAEHCVEYAELQKLLKVYNVSKGR